MSQTNNATPASRSAKPLPYWLQVILAILGFMVNGPAIFRWMLALVLVAFPPIYLAYNPAHYTPLVDSLFSVFLFLLAYWIGNTRESVQAAQKANDRWLPQAESVILRLMTLRANVTRFSALTKANCSEAECELPELKDESLRVVRMKIKGDCEAASQRLADIGYQLEDAIEDWRRFIIANCRGSECERIFQALRQRQERLSNENIDYKTGEPNTYRAPEEYGQSYF